MKNRKREYGYYRRTFDPLNASDRRAMRRMVAAGEKCDDGGWMFCYLPLGDPANGMRAGTSCAGPRRRCPLGVDIYTPYGWNNLGAIAEAFARGETVWIESAAE